MTNREFKRDFEALTRNIHEKLTDIPEMFTVTVTVDNDNKDLYVRCQGLYTDFLTLKNVMAYKFITERLSVLHLFSKAIEREIDTHYIEKHLQTYLFAYVSETLNGYMKECRECRSLRGERMYELDLNERATAVMTYRRESLQLFIRYKDDNIRENLASVAMNFLLCMDSSGCNGVITQLLRDAKEV